MSKTETHRILARDGLELVSYLTCPLGASGPTPMVLLVHGGLWVRDKFEYEPHRQWLASRGYAVLCVNYRGSGGLAKRTPDLFAAGVDIVGPSHVGSLIRSIPPYWKNILHELENRIGPVEDI